MSRIALVGLSGRLATGSLLVALATVGCGGGEEASAPAAAPQSSAAAPAPPSDLPPVEVLDIQEGLPEGFPQDLPMFPGARSARGASPRDGQTSATFEVEAPPGEVAEFYKRELAGSGWNLDSHVELGGQTMVSSSKGEKRADVMILETSAGSQIVINVRGS